MILELMTWEISEREQLVFVVCKQSVNVITIEISATEQLSTPFCVRKLKKKKTKRSKPSTAGPFFFFFFSILFSKEGSEKVQSSFALKKAYGITRVFSFLQKDWKGFVMVNTSAGRMCSYYEECLLCYLPLTEC